VSDNEKKLSGEGKATPGAPTSGPTPGGVTPANPPASLPSAGPGAGHEAQPNAQGGPKSPAEAAAKPPAPPPAGGPPKPPPPKNPGFVTVVVDGREVVVKPGTNMIDAAKQAGSEIPYYCWHPRLSIAANCRMCLVEASNAPKLVPACQTPLAEGQIIKTTTAKVKDQQRATLEFLLLNHPVDCSICDQAGECKLQDYYMKYDFKPSRLEGGKVLKSKRKVLGPQVVLDQERCILCTRCVRFMSEVAQEPQLGVFGRGSHERIDTFPGEELNSNYAGNTVDICPVGALLNRDFRFRARAFFLSAAPSVCTGCSRGCSTFADFYMQDVYRYRPRENEAINKSWMCDQGRLSYKYLNKGRVLEPRLGRLDDTTAPVVATRADAAKRAAQALSGAKGKGLAMMASPVASNEDLMAGLAFAKESLGLRVVYVAGRPNGEGDKLLMTADKNPNRKGLEWIAAGLDLALKPFEELVSAINQGQVTALYALGCEVPTLEESFATTAKKLELFVAQAFNDTLVTAQAHVLLPASTHVEEEGSFVNLDGIVQRFRKAFPARNEVQPHFKWVSDIQGELGVATRHASAREVFKAFAEKIPELAKRLMRPLPEGAAPPAAGTPEAQQFDWDKSAPWARKGQGINPLPAAADGRPAGYREFGTPRVKGI